MKVDMIVLRHPKPWIAITIYLKIQNSCIINAGDGAHEHPTQALLRLFFIN